VSALTYWWNVCTFVLQMQLFISEAVDGYIMGYINTSTCNKLTPNPNFSSVVGKIFQLLKTQNEVNVLQMTKNVKKACCMMSHAISCCVMYHCPWPVGFNFEDSVAVAKQVQL